MCVVDVPLYSLNIFTRKSVFDHKQHFIHLNLCIALLLGITIFISGIEAASDYRVRRSYLEEIIINVDQYIYTTTVYHVAQSGLVFLSTTI